MVYTDRGWMTMANAKIQNLTRDPGALILFPDISTLRQEARNYILMKFGHQLQVERTSNRGQESGRVGYIGKCFKTKLRACKNLKKWNQGRSKFWTKISNSMKDPFLKKITKTYYFFAVPHFEPRVRLGWCKEGIRCYRCTDKWLFKPKMSSALRPDGDRVSKHRVLDMSTTSNLSIS